MQISFIFLLFSDTFPSCFSFFFFFNRHLFSIFYILHIFSVYSSHFLSFFPKIFLKKVISLFSVFEQTFLVFTVYICLFIQPFSGKCDFVVNTTQKKFKSNPSNNKNQSIHELNILFLEHLCRMFYSIFTSDSTKKTTEIKGVNFWEKEIVLYQQRIFVSKISKEYPCKPQKYLKNQKGKFIVLEISINYIL